jgi:elongator complex protein 2
LFGQLGYFGGYFSPKGDYVLAHGYNGSFHLWEQVDGGNKTERNLIYVAWKPQISISGHFGEVSDLSWDTKYNYFVTVRFVNSMKI